MNKIQSKGNIKEWKKPQLIKLHKNYIKGGNVNPSITEDVAYSGIS
jgi:hypothetical protein